MKRASGKDNTGKACDLVTSIESYDKYLRRAINMQINNTNTLYSRIVSCSHEERNTILESLYKAFESDCDKFQPITCILKILNIEDKENFLVKESAVVKIGRIGSYVTATIIPIIISIIQVLLAK